MGGVACGLGWGRVDSGEGCRAGHLAAWRGDEMGLRPHSDSSLVSPATGPTSHQKREAQREHMCTLPASGSYPQWHHT